MIYVNNNTFVRILFVFFQTALAYQNYKFSKDPFSDNCFINFVGCVKTILVELLKIFILLYI